MFEAIDPNYIERVKSLFARQPMMQTIGATLTRIEPGFVEITQPYRPELTQQNGYMHAGVVGTIADNAGGCAAATLAPPDTDILSVEYKLNLLAPAAGELFRAQAQVLRAGRTLTVCRVDVKAVRGESEKLCAAMQLTLIRIPIT